MYPSLNFPELLNASIWILATILIYVIAIKLYKLSSNIVYLQPFTHPLITSTTCLLLIFHFTHTSVGQFQSSTTLLSAMLGPATVALALPLFNQFKLLIQMGFRALLPIIIASIIAPVFSWLAVYLLDAPLNLQLTMLTKSITTPLAMDTASAIGGIAPLAAIFVITTGIVGAVFGPIIFSLFKVEDHMAQGLALGSVAHAIGTARAISISEQCAAFSTLALCLNGVITALLLPLLFA